MGCMHTLNAVFLLLDTALNSLVSNTHRILFSMFLVVGVKSLSHLAFSWLMQAFSHIFSISAISLVPAGIFCTLELCLCHLPMGHPRLWFVMVRTKQHHFPLSISNLILWIWQVLTNIVFESFSGGHIPSLSSVHHGLLCGKSPAHHLHPSSC